MESLVKRTDLKEGLEKVQEVLYTLADPKEFFHSPVILFLNDGQSPEVSRSDGGGFDEQIRLHFDKQEYCVYCVVNGNEMVVLPIGSDIQF